MSKKELKQVEIFKLLGAKTITQKEASELTGISIRQVRTKFKRYILNGPTGLIHRSRGKPSCKRWINHEEDFAISLLRSDWKGFGPTFASQKLKELHGITVSKERLRQSMIANRIWIEVPIKRSSRKRRERRKVLGIMVQLDGSPHDWFEGRGEKCTLLVFIDDATSKILWLEFAKSESLFGVMSATKNYFEAYGRPHSLYTDYGSVFSVNLNNKDRSKITQFERIMDELGVSMIHAKSPQAKGRVERANKTLQDRLIKEMRLANICTIEEANKFVKEIYIAKHNSLFAVPASFDGDEHRSLDDYDLNSIFSIKQERIIQNDFTVQYKNKILQLEKHQKAYIRPKELVVIRENLRKDINISIRSIDLNFFEIAARPSKVIQEKVYNNNPERKIMHMNSRRWNNDFASPTISPK